MGNLFETKQISSVLIAKSVQPFSDDNYIYEMKWESERCGIIITTQQMGLL